MIHDITSKAGRYRSRKRIGRGPGSGHGKTSGRGHKGAGSRSGNKYRAYFEGGQMTWARRMPKRGFTNAQFRTDYHIVNLKAIADRFGDGDTVDPAALVKAGLIRNERQPLKILGEGDLTIKISVTAHKVSKSAEAKITGAGGSVSIIEQKKWTRAAAPKKKAAAAPVDDAASSDNGSSEE